MLKGLFENILIVQLNDQISHPDGEYVCNALINDFFCSDSSFLLLGTNGAFLM